MDDGLIALIYEAYENVFSGESTGRLFSIRKEEILKSSRDAALTPRLSFLNFKITNRCNSNCRYCSHAIGNAANEEKREVPKKIVMKAISDAAGLGAVAVALNGGETLLHPAILDIVTYASERGILPMLMTNALVLPERLPALVERGLRFLIISFDSLDRRVYERQRGADFNLALAGIDAASGLVHDHPEAKVLVSVVLTRQNKDEITSLIRYMSKRGIYTQLSPYHHFDPFVPDELSVTDRDEVLELVESLLSMKTGGYLMANSEGFIKHLPDFFSGKRVPDGYSCLVGQCALFVNAKQEVRPCWDESFEPLGTLALSSLSELWSGERMRGYRARMLDARCPGCWYMCTGEIACAFLDVAQRALWGANAFR